MDKNKPHLFLTGKKGVGKSTLLQKLLGNDQHNIGGFYTVRAADVEKEGPSLHLLRAGTGETPGHGNLLCLCPPQEDLKEAERFDRLGCRALIVDSDTRLVVMDELGRSEKLARCFQGRVLQLLDGSIPVLGVLQEGDFPLTAAVSAHPKVRVVEVTAENREKLARELKFER